MKKLWIILFSLVAIFSLSFSTSALAAKPVDVGVSTEPPDVTEDSQSEDEFTTYTIAKPSTSSVVDLTKNTMYFSGVANNSTLYTNSHFKGKSTITYKITNNSSTDLIVKIYKSGAWLSTETLTVNANSTSTGTVSSLSKSELYYMSFSAPSDFSGYVK